MAFAPLDRLCLGTVLAALALLSPARGAMAQSSPSLSYWVTVREIDGHESVPAHLVCRPDRRCSGQMSVSTDKGYLRIFVIAMIDGGEALVRFHGDGKSVACHREDFTRIPLKRPPGTAFAIAYLCDAPRPEPPAPSAEHPVLRNLPHLAALRIDVRPREGE